MEVEALIATIEASLDRRQFDAALEAYETFRDAHPTEVLAEEDQVRIANAYLARGADAKAADAYEQYLVDYARGIYNIEVGFVLGRLLGERLHEFDAGREMLARVRPHVGGERRRLIDDLCSDYIDGELGGSRAPDAPTPNDAPDAPDAPGAPQAPEEDVRALYVDDAPRVLDGESVLTGQLSSSAPASHLPAGGLAAQAAQRASAAARPPAAAGTETGFAVIADQDAWFDIALAARLVANEISSNPTECARLIQHARGFLALGLSEGRAERLARRLKSVGLPARAVAHESFAQLPPAQRVKELQVGDDGVELVVARRAGLVRVAATEFTVFIAGELRAPRTEFTQGFSEGYTARLIAELVGRRASASDSIVVGGLGANAAVFMLDLVTRAGVRYRVIGDRTFAYPTGVRGRGRSPLSRLVRALDRLSTPVPRNRAYGLLTSVGDWRPFRFGSPAEFELYELFLLRLLRAIGPAGRPSG